jgi:PncC family amidohydrolase
LGILPGSFSIAFCLTANFKELPTKFLSLLAMNQQHAKVSQIAEKLASTLTRQGLKIVFAESCTAGMASAMLATVPGISSVLCGSNVTYREQTKTEWLKVAPDLIASYSAESKQVTAAMAERVLDITPESDIAAAITGHLGPGVESEIDGQVFIAIACRDRKNTQARQIRLEATGRRERQIEAAGVLLQRVNVFLSRC